MEFKSEIKIDGINIYEEEQKEFRLDKTPADMILHEYQLKSTSPPVLIQRTTDLTPVNDLICKLERVFEREENIRNRAWCDFTPEFLEATKRMNKEQLRYVMVHLLGMVEKYASLYQSTLDNPEKHLKFVKEYRELEKRMKENEIK